MSRTVDVLIIGAGLAGLTAADQLRQAGHERAAWQSEAAGPVRQADIPRQAGLDGAAWQPDSVLVLEKSRGVGGRMATRRIGEAVFDHGAQFMTVRDPGFARAMAGWTKSGVVAPWFGDKNTRYRGQTGMTALAKQLSQQVDVQLSARVVSIAIQTEARAPGAAGTARAAESAQASGAADPARAPGTQAAAAQVSATHSGHSQVWQVLLESGEVILARSLVLTAPVPQSLAMLDAWDSSGKGAGGKGVVAAVLDPAVRARLEAVTYDPCIAVMARLENRSAIPSPGWLRPRSGPISWIADNQAKGISPVPSVTLHAAPDFSRAHWDEDPRELGEQLLARAASDLGSRVLEFQVHAWRYSRPTTPLQTTIRSATDGSLRGDLAVSSGQPANALAATVAGLPVVFAGDAFAAPRVEGAYLSGRAAARLLLSLPPQPEPHPGSGA
ncbi:NAD(P)/FAD-dependent oxidoreductase [Spirochaeta africana]|uniref:Putative NAD/FAD-dependent oxidoreductase n=1 Tax=Spirochaeta africana (strain ATCC 700263 / DSM 8902 / Z-7692) TaxID=889378 RepID=H9UHK1_SPIAZ|nr:NAD(P)-binding protein [Spirochaeta africana]AFG36994.1 putative NAD/FAD-dependent oxidoreductase [Spirochaeta africana DSM 8902]